MGRTNKKRRAKRLAKQKAKEEAEKKAKQEARQKAKAQTEWEKNSIQNALHGRKHSVWNRDFSTLVPLLRPLALALAGKWWQCHVCLGWSKNERLCCRRLSRRLMCKHERCPSCRPFLSQQQALEIAMSYRRIRRLGVARYLFPSLR
ncbi:uncharacterized protein BO66DRAFT_405659 [Aspergillus aculeatinus CBS 121060]|uniref:Uncharacterized protein n=1 Tax=Aspergillus aculeatinus CBS 121060 TaxID=1448322 RepID=A0ACD1GVJ2_9EURO|nr:hypothetical protein BO66DRAFT_405659 [Aspergillus aculeatinus CBS 121060]RAH65348.1 hypothetical protein BO66DRAFT_405659 [Aspergillus aculeatinus CBS 121060]